MRELAQNRSAGGLLEPVWGLLENALAAAQNRLELFRVEVQEEKLRFVEVVLLASALVVLATLTLALATFTLAIYLWREGPEIGFSVMILTYAIGAGLAWRLLKARLKRTPLFADSAAELEKDRECIIHRRV
jgi:uncharacterized membrane protein YqjE